MSDLSAAEASRRFSDVLDAVEHRGESFVIRRHGRPVARVVPAGNANGTKVKEFLRKYHPDKEWAKEVAETRSLLHDEPRT